MRISNRISKIMQVFQNSIPPEFSRRASTEWEDYWERDWKRVVISDRVEWLCELLENQAF